MTAWSQVPPPPVPAEASAPVLGLDADWKAFVVALQQTTRLPVLSSVLVQEGRRLLDVDRLALLYGPSSRVRVKAVSGQSGLNAHSPAMLRLESLVRQVLAVGEPVIFQAGITEPPQELEDALAGYIEQSHCQYLAIVPLTTTVLPPAPGDPDEPAVPRPRPSRVLGAMVIERWNTPVASEALGQRGDDFLLLATCQLEQAFKLSWIPLKEFFANVGEFAAWLRGRRLAIAGLIAAALVAVTLILAFVPWPYRIDARGRILPSHRQQVFAPWDGQVEELKVRSGQLVAKDEVLLLLRNDELMAEVAATESKWLEQRKQIAALISQVEGAEREAMKEEALRLQGDLAVARRELLGIEEQRTLLRIRKDRLIVKSPLAGRITTFQLSELLTGRPVHRGDALMEIADEKSPWRLELDVQEHRAGRLLTAFHDLGPRPVTYRVLTQPEQTWSATLDEIGSRTVLRPDGQVIEVHAPIETDRQPALAMGADIRARVDCGPTVLGDALFGDLVEFVRRWLWW